MAGQKGGKSPCEQRQNLNYEASSSDDEEMGFLLSEDVEIKL